MYGWIDPLTKPHATRYKPTILIFALPMLFQSIKSSNGNYLRIDSWMISYEMKLLNIWFLTWNYNLNIQKKI